jgi:glutaredoxin 3
MKPVTLYTTDRCSMCASAKALLQRRGIGYEEINLARDPDGRAHLAEKTGMITFPQVVIGGATIGGFAELLAADREGRLSGLLAASADSGVAR